MYYSYLRFKQACIHLLNGGVIAHPTDTIYGLSCLANDLYAADKMLAMKRRSATKGLILLTSQLDFILPYVDEHLPIRYWHKLRAPTAQPTTYLVPAAKHAPYVITGNHSTVAIRLARSALIQQLCHHSQCALLSTSANLSAQPCARSIVKLRVYFDHRLDYILLPPKEKNTPSMIIDLVTGKRYR